jgi:hypothetical protein
LKQLLWHDYGIPADLSYSDMHHVLTLANADSDHANEKAKAR